MKGFVLGVFMLLFSVFVAGQESSAGHGSLASIEQDRLESIMTILGVAEEEQLSEETIERFEQLEHHPVDLNLSSFNRLLGSGLFSQFQIASLIDYRAEHGDVLSFEELSAVDGFGRDFAMALKPYVSLYSSLAPGSVRKATPSGSATLRSTWKPGAFTLKGKSSFNYGDRFSTFVASNTENLAFNVAWYGRKHLGKVIVGDFNARFGQGLTLWNSFSMSGLSSPSTLYRRPTGLAPSSSYAGTGLRGVAADFNWKHFSFSAFTVYPSFTSGINLSYLFRYGQFSLTGVGRYKNSLELGKVGLDTRLCIKGYDVFGEVCVDFLSMSMAGVGGLTIPVGNTRFGLVGRYYPANFTKELSGAVRSGTYSKDEAGGAISWEWKKIVLSADYYLKLSTGREQLKFLASGELPLSGTMSLKPRMSVRLRTQGEKPRTDVRCDFLWKPVPWSNVLRINWLHCAGNGWLAYWESGYVAEKVSAYVRVTGFLIDNWDDRIYVYERDAPGNFNIPSYYGRGFSLSLTGSWKHSFRFGRLKLYGSAIIKKPGKTGLRFQMVYDF